MKRMKRVLALGMAVLMYKVHYMQQIKFSKNLYNESP